MAYSREHDLLTEKIAREEFPGDARLARVFYTMIKQECAFDLDVITGVRDSPAGARGIAQLMPRFHRVDPLDPPAALRYAADYLRRLIVFCGDVRAGVAAYNWGPGNIQAVMQAHGAAWESALPEETRRYVRVAFADDGEPLGHRPGAAPVTATLFRDPGTGWLLPAAGFISQGFGPTDEPRDGPATYHGVSYPHFNKGIDIGCPVGTPVSATVAGTVIWAGFRSVTGEAIDDGTGWGLTVWVQQPNGVIHNYGHLSALAVTKDDQVAAGALLGQSGNSGASSGPHLSYDVFLLGESGLELLDPTPFLLAPTGSVETVDAVTLTVVPDDGLRLRAAPNAHAAVLAIVARGTVVALRRADWYPVRHGALDGWMWGAYLNLIADAAPALATELVAGVAAVVVTDALNLRAELSDSAAILTTAPQGTRVSLRRADWYPVLVGEQGGWMGGSFLAIAPTRAAAAPRGEPTVAGVTLTVAVDGAVNLREHPDSAAPVLASVPAGATVLLRRRAWYPLRVHGHDGWSFGGLLAFAVEASAPAPGLTVTAAAARGVNLRAAPADDGELLTTLPSGTRGPLSARPWLPVLANGVAGWLRGDALAAAAA